MTHQFRGILALLLVTLVWGTTFPAMKDLTVYFSPVWIIFIRFALAALLLAPFLYKAGRDDLVSGGLLGVLLFFCYVFQVEGLALTSSNRNAFICGMNVLVVPLLGVVGGRLPEKRIVLALLLAVAGLAALCWDGGAWGRGDTLALLSAFSFGVYIKMMEFRTRRASRLMTLSAAQILTVALCAALWLLAREVPRTAIEAGQDFANYWDYIARGLGLYAVNLLYLGVVATAAIISLQSWGQSRASANEAAVMYSFEPAAAAFFAYFWLGETMTARGWFGAALLIAGMIVSQWNTRTPRPAAALAPE
ncbi:MAG: multidrug transporter permease [Massilia sp.]|nr:multidrug transporter permease [Massilia sp.]